MCSFSLSPVARSIYWNSVYTGRAIEPGSVPSPKSLYYLYFPFIFFIYFFIFLFFLFFSFFSFFSFYLFLFLNAYEKLCSVDIFHLIY